MKAIKIFVLLIIIFSGDNLFAQTNINLDQVKNYVGYSITVCGKIFGAKFRDIAKKSPSLLNMGGNYPNQIFTIVIMDDVRKRFSYDPEKKTLNKTICVTGKIQIYNGKPEIIVHNEKQLKVPD